MCAMLFACCCSEDGTQEVIRDQRRSPGPRLVDVFHDPPADKALMRRKLGRDVEMLPLDQAFRTPPEVRPPEVRADGTLAVRVAKDEAVRKIGLDIANHSNVALRIKKVKDGLVSLHNQRFPGMAIQAGDLILEVNGCSGNAEQLLSTIATADCLDLVLRQDSV
mmetsp:Transcript_48299/g.121648  ORF Transcript_48299/g.121648 Transcript_48299/m.121648 type:complete len:164 (+) Transcript_48299:116-607(+)|eukprot:CAMPEP_0115502704 /NCGR_PEP_ID=MMETSP0271-20121206/69087_1 /TAXON_ID=71861 /ORGANISM="Scrippsiella trochoidea, Strain CCMP3099" /LENGTH=163 /DNA_ID=CAMNT_0002931751 /DNA_START=80 /DNA_END=571 /DNA_ORIENTATION=-